MVCGPSLVFSFGPKLNKNQVECKFGLKKCSFIHQEDIENAYHNAKSENQIKDKILYKMT